MPTKEENGLKKRFLPGKEEESVKNLPGFPKKILIDTQPPSSGTCAAHKALYAVAGVIGVLYLAFVLDKPSFQHYSNTFKFLGHVETAFQAMEKYSPFHEFMESDEDFIKRMKESEPSKGPGVRVMTKSELALYNGSPDSPGLYLAILGQVYDVSKGRDYYGPGGGYAFFSGKDGSRAFVSGQFDEEGLIDDTTGLSHGDYIGLKEWIEFYEKDYIRVGVVQGRYYTDQGDVTEQWKDLQKSISAAINDKDKQDVEKTVFPPCNVEWAKDKGSRFWCTNKSGGVARKWVGVPRKLFYPGREERCACVRNTGSPSTDPGASSTRGDLDNPHLKEYAGCTSSAHECWLKD